MKFFSKGILIAMVIVAVISILAMTSSVFSGTFLLLSGFLSCVAIRNLQISNASANGKTFTKEQIRILKQKKVYVTKTGKKFHYSRMCPSCPRNGLTTMSQWNAMKHNYEPCKHCLYG